MKKKILLLYHSSNQVILMNSLCDNINKVGLYADSFDTTSLKFYSPNHHKSSFLLWLYKRCTKLPYGANYIRRHFMPWLIIHLARNYDIIDVQSLFKPMYSYIVPKLKKRGKRIKIHIWGSDFYQFSQDPQHVNWQRSVYEAADIIQIATEQMKADFIKKFPELSSKIRTGVFGNQHLDDLRDFELHPEKEDLSFIHNVEHVKGKIIVTCGYNARPRCQHLKIIEALNKLPQELLDKIFVIFPMTYLQYPDYMHTIDDALHHSKFDYVVLKSFLTENQLLSLRTKTDIFINIIVSDALSSSTQEHLYCKSIVIVGDWLPYSIFDKNGIYYLKTSLEQLYNNIYYALNNFEKLKMKCVNNPQKLLSITSWDKAILKFKKIYEELSND